MSPNLKLEHALIGMVIRKYVFLNFDNNDIIYFIIIIINFFFFWGGGT